MKSMNIRYIYIYIRYQTLLEINGPTFEPYCTDDIWESIEDIYSIITSNLSRLISELSLCEDELSYILTIYKFYKKKYR